jgi:hypothetical protein
MPSALQPDMASTPKTLKAMMNTEGSLETQFITEIGYPFLSGKNLKKREMKTRQNSNNSFPCVTRLLWLSVLTVKLFMKALIALRVVVIK